MAGQSCLCFVNFHDISIQNPMISGHILVNQWFCALLPMSKILIWRFFRFFLCYVASRMAIDTPATLGKYILTCN